MSMLYQRYLGTEFYQLAPLLQRFHSEPGNDWVGEVRVTWTKNPLLRAFILLGGLPREADSQRIAVRIKPETSGEKWLRHFGSHRMASKQELRGRVLRESFGPFSLVLDSYVQRGALHQMCSRCDLLGLPVPSLFSLKIKAHEWQDNGCFNFDVEIGLVREMLIRYRGWLLPSEIKQ